MSRSFKPDTAGGIKDQARFHTAEVRRARKKENEIRKKMKIRAKRRTKHRRWK